MQLNIVSLIRNKVNDSSFGPVLLLLLVGLLFTLVTGCSQHKQPKYKQVAIHTYRQKQDDDSFLYWYVLMSNNNTYYYSSQIPITTSNFSSTTFIRVSGVSLPSSVQQQIDKSEKTQDEDVESDDLPTDVEQAVEAQAENETTTSAPSNSEGSSSVGESSGGDSGGDSGGE